MSETALPPPMIASEVRHGLVVNSVADLRELASAMTAAAVRPWRPVHADWRNWTSDLDSPETLRFRRDAWGALEEIELCMDRTPTGYRLVSLIEDDRVIGRSSWNWLLREFGSMVVAPAMLKSADFSCTVGFHEQGPADWVSATAARHLRRSFAAGMKPGLDWAAPAARNWLKFLITVHEDGDGLECGQMVPWLADVDGWSMRDAVRLFEVSDGILNALFEYHRSLGALRDPNEPNDGPIASPKAALA